MEHNKATRADGFLAKFYEVFWEDVKDDLKELFQASNVGKLDI